MFKVFLFIHNTAVLTFAASLYVKVGMVVVYGVHTSLVI